MIKILKKILWFILTFLIAVIIFCWLIFLFTKNKDNSDTQTYTYTVSTWDIEKTIEIYGNAELKKEEILWFDIPWQVARIYINEWDFVTKWQILASLDTEDIENDIRQAELNLENSKINYQDLENWWTDTQILQAENALEQSKSALRLAENQYDELINQDENSTWTNNDLAIQAKRNEIKNLRNTIRLQEQSLQDIIEWATDSQKNIAANSVEQWEITVNKAKKWLESYRITAPFNWKIRKIDFEKWDKISTTNPKFIYIENPDLIDISLSLDQIDVVQVKIWMPAEIEFDTYPWKIFYGEISDIDTKANISAWVVSYTVKVNIEKWNYTIYGWMTANVKIILDRQTNIIQTPTTYIQEIWEKNYVVNGSGDLIEVELWISNDSMVEIISWLKIGDKIVKEVSKTSTNGLSEDLMDMHDEYHQ